VPIVTNTESVFTNLNIPNINSQQNDLLFTEWANNCTLIEEYKKLIIEKESENNKLLSKIIMINKETKISDNSKTSIYETHSLRNKPNNNDNNVILNSDDDSETSSSEDEDKIVKINKISKKPIKHIVDDDDDEDEDEDDEDD
jgi:hypothetical protein